MKVYHGSSSRSITKFDLRHSLRTNLDFGKGIYFTTNIEQAIAWSCRNKPVGAVYECEIALFDNSSHFLIKPTFYQKVHRGGFTLSSGIYCPKTP